MQRAEFGNKNIFLSEKAPLNTPFVENKDDVDRMTLYSFKSPLEALHADIAGIRFLDKLAVNVKYCLLLFYLFTSVIYTYLMRNHKLLAKKCCNFIKTLEKKRTENIKLQTNHEF